MTTSRPSGGSDRARGPENPESIWAELSRAQRSRILEALGIDPQSAPPASAAIDPSPQESTAAHETIRSLSAGIEALSPAVAPAPSRFVDRAATGAAAQNWDRSRSSDRIVAMNFDAAQIAGGTAPVTGSLACQLVHVPAGVPIRAVLLEVIEPGCSLRVGANLAAVYELDGTRVALTADQAGTWASDGRKYMPIRPTVRPRPHARTVYVCFVSAGRTRPSFGVASRRGPVSRSTDQRGLRVAGRLPGHTGCPARVPLTEMSADRQYWVGLA